VQVIVRRHGLRAQLRSPSRLAAIGVNLVVYYLLLRWAVDNIHPGTLMEHLRQLPGQALAGSLLINMAAMILYGMRMALLLGGDFRAGFSIVNLGYALNTLMPLRLGDAMKIYLGHRFFGVPLLGIFAASVAEKIVDLAMLLLLGAALAAFAAGEVIQAGVLYPVTIVVASGLAAFVLFRIYIVRILKLLPKRGRLRRTFLELHKHAGGYPVFRVLAVSLAIWALNVALVYFAFNTYVPGFALALPDAVTLLLVVALAVAIPSAPAGIGLFEAGIVAFLTQMGGASKEAALAAAAAFHLITMLPPLAIAACVLWARGLASLRSA